ncbi:MAG: CTP synthase, partial [Candidatus Methanomethyliaceae archaeon]
TKLKDSYISIIEALKHAGAKLGISPELEWIETTKFEEDPSSINLKDYDGIVVLPGFGARGTEGKILAIEYARVNKIPFLGICYGFQLAVVEFARNVLGYKNAHTTEVDPNTPYPVVDLLPEQKNLKNLGGSMRLGAYKIILKEGTMVSKLYGSNVISERHRHRYEVNQKYLKDFEEAGMIISGISYDGKSIEFIELKDHPFFLGTQSHPEFKSRPGKPSPPFLGFLDACIKYKKLLK